MSEQAVDMTALQNLLGSLMNNSNSTPSPPPVEQNGGGLDMSAIQNLLSGLMGSSSNNSSSPNPPPVEQNNNTNGGGLDISAIQGILGGLMGGSNGNNSGNNNSNTLPNLDLNMIGTIQKAFMNLSRTDKNVDLLKALKPHLSEKRSKKVDDAIRIMQLIKMLPLLKESGILGNFNLFGSDK